MRTLVGCATAFADILAVYQVPLQPRALMTSIVDNLIIVILIINLMLPFDGIVVDMAALILITTPTFLPIAVEIGMDLIGFGIVLMMSLGLSPLPHKRVPVRGLRHRRGEDRKGRRLHLAVLSGDARRPSPHHLCAGHVFVAAEPFVLSDS
ncbi:MAG: TRAP transporter large permease subunit [Pseudomonadota bacterium]